MVAMFGGTFRESCAAEVRRAALLPPYKGGQACAGDNAMAVVQWAAWAAGHVPLGGGWPVGVAFGRGVFPAWVRESPSLAPGDTSRVAGIRGLRGGMRPQGLPSPPLSWGQMEESLPACEAPEQGSLLGR